MNPSTATVMLRACRVPSSSRTLVSLPSSSSSAARAALRTESQLHQRTTFRRTSHFSTSCAAWNAVQSETTPATTTTSTATTTTEGTTPPPTPLHEHQHAKPRGYEPDSYRAWQGPDKHFVRTSTSFIGRVSRTGTMRKTVRVSRNVQVWDRNLQKYYTRETHALVHDPDDLLVEGDLVSYGGFPPSLERDRRARDRPVDTKGKVACCVFDVLTPFGSSVEQRIQARSSASASTSTVKLAS